VSSSLLSFRIAIWNYKIFVSLPAVGLWLAGLALNIYGTFRSPYLCAPCSHLLSLVLRRLDNGTALAHSFRTAGLKRPQIKVEPKFNPTLGFCFIFHLHKSLINTVGIMVVDLVLLVGMLVGLLRYAHRSSTGIWRLLYQQVVHCPFSSVGC
jgi:hypothetical protein